MFRSTLLFYIFIRLPVALNSIMVAITGVWSENKWKFGVIPIYRYASTVPFDGVTTLFNPVQRLCACNHHQRNLLTRVLKNDWMSSVFMEGSTLLNS